MTNHYLNPNLFFVFFVSFAFFVSKLLINQSR